MKKCKVCGQLLYQEPVLTLEDMPSVAQYLPDDITKDNDHSVNLEVYQCQNCGLVQLQISPVEYYREVIRATSVSEEMTLYRQNQFKNFVNQYNCEKILEVGCGAGEYLAVMAKFCEKSYGIEFNDKNIHQCEKRNLNVTKMYIEDEFVKIPNAPFDSFYILNYLEHIPNIVEFLTGVRNNLTDKAVGLVEVPNFDMMIKQNLFSEFIPDHLYYFTKESLQFTLNYCGFEILDIGDTWHDYIISATVRKRNKLDLKLFKDSVNTMSAGINSYVAKYKDVAVWGAGHQAFAILSLAKLSEKIKYIVDSADFKQGKLSPATHIPIVSPEYFRNNPTTAIIIMAGSYSLEIVDIVKSFNLPKLNIAVVEGNNLKIIQEV